MGELLPNNEFTLIAADEGGRELEAEYEQFIRARELELDRTPGETPFTDRLDRERIFRKPIWLEDELLRQIEPESITKILNPSDEGFTRISDRSCLTELRTLIQQQRDGYLAAQADRKPAVERRIIKPETRFELKYLAPIDFAIEHTDCALQWEFFDSQDIVYIRWPRS